MSETNKSNKVPNNVIKYMAHGVDEELKIENVKGNSQEANINNIPGIPMEIKVEGYEIILDEKSGKVLRVKDNRSLGEITDDRKRKKVIDAIKKKDKNEKDR